MIIRQVVVAVLLMTLWEFVFVASGLAANSDDNSAPILDVIPRYYVMEGDKLQMTISTIDPDGDQVAIGVSAHPAGSIIMDNGDGTADFEWIPDFAGPYSSDGSPFELVFWASDGVNATTASSEVIVINNNRKPYIVYPDTVIVNAGQELTFDIAGFDPDFDSLHWLIPALPEGLVFDSGNPGTFTWMTSFGDSGFYAVSIGLVDQYGATDTADIVLNILSTIVYALYVDTVAAYPGEVVAVNINLENLEPIAGFEILVNYDVSILTISSVSEIGTRVESFEYFSYRLNEEDIPGDVRIIGVADLEDGAAADDLTPGAGSVAKLSFLVSRNLGFAGYYVPVIFVFRDTLEGNDNTLIGPSGERIGQDKISYSNGYVKIKSTSPSSLGDINLNAISYEVGDIIYFTNFFINPGRYPFSPVQLLNSDVNQDGYGATVADLVFMINRLLSINQPGSKLRPDVGAVAISSNFSEGSFAFYYDSEVELGGLAMTLLTLNAIDIETRMSSDMEEKGMLVKSMVDGNLLRLLIYSEDGHTMPNGTSAFLEIENNYDFEIKDIQFSSVDGFLLRITMKDDLESNLPKEFILYQNYPNPFNPITEIGFYLSGATSVKLTVFDILGREVKTLVDGVLTAGNHSAVWDGLDYNGSAVSSGVYFYRLCTETFSAKKKMLLLK